MKATYTPVSLPLLIVLFFSLSYFGVFATQNGIRFIENKGQVADVNGNSRPDIKFRANANGSDIYIRNAGVSYVVYAPKEIPSEDDTANFDATPTLLNRIDMDFAGANTHTYTEKNKEANGVYNYYLSHCPSGVESVKAYYEVVQKNIYNNVDVYYYGGAQGTLKYDIVVKPGGNPSEIALEYTGAKEIKSENGQIKIYTSIGEMTEWMPRVYQNIEGKIIDVKAEYVVNESTVRFKVGEYNSSYDLVIDPTWVTYYGGAGDDRALAIASDNNSNAISTGYTSSNPFPVNTGPAFSGGGSDAYILSLNAGGALNFCTYFGGTAADRGYGITTDALNNIYIAGSTSSTGLATAGVVRTTPVGGGDAFVAMFNNAGVRQWCTYYGGTSADEGIDLELDRSGNIVLTGIAGTGFPTTLNAAIGTDIFTAKFNGSATAVLWSTCIGSSGADKATGLDIDGNNNIVVTGIVPETSTGFPVTNGSTISNNVAVSEGVVIKYNTNGGITWSTYFGGRGADQCLDVAIDSQNDIIITGYNWTSNPISQFATTPGAYQAGPLGAATCYLAKFDGSNNATGAPFIKWFTYFGSNTEASGITVDKTNDDIFICSEVYGNGLPPWGCAHQKNNANPVGLGQEDHVIARFDKNGNFLCDTYIGGTGHDEGMHTSPAAGIVGGRIALAPNGSAYITGTSNANAGTWVYPVLNGVQMTSGGGVWEAVVVSICAYSCGTNTVSPSFTASKTNICPNEAISFTDNSTMCDGRKIEWLWSFPGANTTSSTLQNPSGISYSANGTYNVKLVVKTPCGTDSLILNNYIVVTSPTAIISVVNNITCFGLSNGGGTVGVIGGTAPYTYNWSSNGGSNASVSGFAAGVYTVTVTDTYGCTSTNTLTVTQPLLLTVNAIQINSVSCFGENNGAAGASANGGTTPYAYSWNTGSNNHSVSSLIAGVYTVSVTDSYGCLASTSVAVAEPTTLNDSIIINDALCNGSATGSIIASASGGVGGYIYTWSNAVAGNTAANITAGIYSVTITDANGCTLVSGGTINEPTVLSVLFITNDAHCNQSDGSAAATAAGGTPGYSYRWNNGSASSSNNNIPAGVYSVTITDANGCTLSDTTTVNNLNGVRTNISSWTPPSCNSYCDGLANANHLGGTGPYSYSWNTGSTNTGIVALCSGIYSVTITDANGCTDASLVNITQPAIINSTLSSTPALCNGQNSGSASLVSTAGGTSPYNYLWQNSNTNSTANNLATGVYSVTVSDANGCTSVFSTNVAEPSSLTVTASSASICAGNNTNISATANGGTPGYTYVWNSSQTGGATTISPTVSSVYSVTVTDANGCTALGTSSVIVYDLPVVDFTADVVSGCGPLCVTLTNQTPNTNSSTWTLNGMSQSTTNTIINHCFTTPGSFNISLNVTDHNGCSNLLTKNNYITVHPDPIAAFNSSPNPTTVLEPTVYFSNASLGSSAWLWSFGDLVNSSSTLRNPSFTYTDTGAYEVTLTAINEFGCSALISDTVFIKNDFSFYIPNTFTPNSDGKNDMFLPQGLGLKEDQFEFYIFNRWGEEIFSSKSISNGWNGKVRGVGETVQQDVYVWKIKTKDINNKLHSYSGHVTLIR